MQKRASQRRAKSLVDTVEEETAMQLEGESSTLYSCTSSHSSNTTTAEEVRCELVTK